MKKHVMTSIEEETHEKALKAGFNISEITEEAIVRKLEEASINEKMKSEHHCQFCGKHDRLATRDDLTGLTWLWPDERWICESCLRAKTAALAVTASIHQ